MNICDKFHRNPSTKYRDIATRELYIGVTGQLLDGQLEGGTDDPKT